MKVTFEIPDDVASNLPEEGLEQELLTDLVCGLYADWKLNSGMASRWLGIPRSKFWEELGRRGIPRQITPGMIEEDAALAGDQ